MSLEDRVAAIEAMSARQRKAEWHRRTGTEAPPAFGSGLLSRALAHELQVNALGALSKADTKRLLAFGNSGKVDPASGAVKPGTWLSRTWHGEVHQVIALESAFSSLSEIAKRITGSHWSGPRFFGLTSPRLGKLGLTSDGS
jgi:Protein of unknown function (DUF2924)